ncbi:MAG TPA: FtsX-like permease family protein [Deltaproteobacteria bacterium]|nr:FtsX-like permease family protein [Deltaproteobacteria bacterium]HOI06009.1 FtsX-like permease family protein [Deltaproteobacteria bacterium]
MSVRETVFQVYGLTKVYRMGEVEVHALRGVDLELYQGEMVVFLGPSGSGKSTFLNILGGLDTATGGRVSYRGRDLSKATEAELTEYRRFHVGFVFQFYNLIPSLTAFVMFISTIDSLDLTRQGYYREYGFCHLFARLKRAPAGVKSQLEGILGVDRVETRVAAEVKLDVPGFAEPVTGRMISLPEGGMPALNRLFLRKGRLPDPFRDDEAVLSETFAQAHGLDIGDPLGAVINGRWQRLVITGVGLSPEFVLQMSPEAISPDFKRYGILWMGCEALARAYDMDGAFNDVVLTLSPGAREQDVITRIDRLLDRYGGLGAYGREDQLSHRLMSNEFRQLRTCARIFPVIFISVSAFLLNVVVSRIVSTQREQVATLKAFGYTNLHIGLHDTKLVVLIALAGTAGGVLVGVWLGKVLGAIYMEIYRFPPLEYTLRPAVVVYAALISLGSALLGAAHAVWRAAGQPPAEALRPEPPARYRVSMVERAGAGRFLGGPTKMIVRSIERRPLRSLLSVFGIAIACFTRQYIGLMGFMDRRALNRLMREGDAVSGALLTADPLHAKALHRSLVAMPRVRGTVVRRDEVRNFFDTQAEPLLFFTFIAMLTACSISFGVVYNSMRIALSERVRELSSLRVLGYTRGEISYILLGELGLLTLAAIPPGFLLGQGLCAYIAHALASDIFRVPFMLSSRTYAVSAAVVITSALVSGLIVRHRLDHLDLVEVLKTKE